jgi:hypothetical protein
MGIYALYRSEGTEPVPETPLSKMWNFDKVVDDIQLQ